MAKTRGSRTFTLQHKASTIIVKEGHDGKCVLQMDGYQEPTDKKFPAAVRQAVTHLLEHAGEMKGTYER